MISVDDLKYMFDSLIHLVQMKPNGFDGFIAKMCYVRNKCMLAHMILKLSIKTYFHGSEVVKI